MITQQTIGREQQFAANDAIAIHTAAILFQKTLQMEDVRGVCTSHPKVRRKNPNQRDNKYQGTKKTAIGVMTVHELMGVIGFLAKGKKRFIEPLSH
jgi:hypothetical protein